MIINVYVPDGTVSAPVADGTRMRLTLGLAANIESVHINTDSPTAEVIYLDKNANTNEIVTDMRPFHAALQAFDAQREADVDAVNAALDALVATDFRRLDYPPLEDLAVANWENVHEGANPSEINRLKASRNAVKSRYPDAMPNNALRLAWKVQHGGDTTYDAKVYPAKLSPLIGG